MEGKIIKLQAHGIIKTSAELAGEFQVHPPRIRTWKAAAKKGLAEVFADWRKKRELDREERDRSLKVSCALKYAVHPMEDGKLRV